ncbi:glycoside hydrolase family 5 protein [Mucilaginibacter robiniae]|uniref:Glycoside hydrolase family 5 protein n=1 Tax=Mucilaginibacter robiniae TaxID=2728022 RepID=A0A7L5DZ64_9SPHI|nr:cellulase family glycosylhydrolase [Mucilaginibacter robiniae]QJD95508.1 glycoside hydrolase family 5 protein [Mucilaginibacter robiniae]
MLKTLKKIVMVALCATIGSTVQAQSGKFISVKGKDIIGTDGKPFYMRGTNLGNWLVPEGYMFKFKSINSPKLINEAFAELMGPEATKAFWKQYLNNYITRADIHFLKSLGMNSIRIPFNYKLFTDEDYLGESNPNHGFELIDRVIGWCKQEGLHVILDMHCAPGGQTGDNIDDGYGYPFLFDDAASQQLTINIWRTIATHYKNETTVMGYDLLNEPIATFFDTAHFNPRLEPLYKRITQVIRTVDNNHIIFIGGAQWDGNFNPLTGPFDAKMVYTFHSYWAPPVKASIQKYLDMRDKYNIPIYIGETGENKDEWIAQFTAVLEQNHIGWHYWPYKKMDNTAGVMSFSKPANYDLVIDYTEKPRGNFADIRKAAPQNREQLKQAIMDVLNQCKFENCTPNTGYIKALGLKIKN